MFSFIIFFSVCLAVFLGYLLRKTVGSTSFHSLEKKWNAKARRVVKHERIERHLLAVLLSGLLGIVIFLIITVFFLPQTLPLPQTTSINWLVTHKHSMTLDYIRFGLFVSIIPVSAVAGWFLFIWRRHH